MDSWLCMLVGHVFDVLVLLLTAAAAAVAHCSVRLVPTPLPLLSFSLLLSSVAV
jgi:hypothetical protein